MLDELYQELLMEHFRNPRHRGSIDPADARYSMVNPLCGDTVEVSLSRDGAHATIQKIAFSGHGCSISQASASMMTSLVSGKTIEEAKAMVAKFRELLSGARTPESAPELGDALALEGVRKFSARLRCALLAWEALERCLNSLSASAPNSSSGDPGAS